MDHKYGYSDLMVKVRLKLRKLGLPDTLFDAEFWEKEMKARQMDALLLAILEERYKAGHYDHLALPVDQVIERWRAWQASPWYFASLGDRPRWVDKCNDAVADWKGRENGSRQQSWNKYKRKWRARRKELGLPSK